MVQETQLVNRRSCSILLALGLALIASLPTMTPVAAQTPTTEDPLQVVASFSILGDLVKNVGGDAVEVTTLIGPGVDAHTYDPAPSDLVVLSKADVIFENGLGFEPWLDRFFASAQPSGARVVVTEGITPREAGAGDAHEGEAQLEEDGDAHEHGQFDPHVWHDVANASSWSATSGMRSWRPTRPVRSCTRRTPRPTSPSWRRWTRPSASK